MSSSKLVYPSVTNDSKIEVPLIHGVKVASPFQWLENLNSVEVRDFVVEQNKLLSMYLKPCEEIGSIKTTLKNMTNQTIISCPTESIGKLFFFMDDGESGGKDSLYFQENITAKPQLLLSPKKIPGRQNSVNYFLRMYSVSSNCKTLAYAFSVSRTSEWMSIRFIDIRTGIDYPEELRNVCKSDICWTLDNEGILYSCFLRPHQQLHHKIVFHRLGTSQMDDIVLIEFPMNAAVTLQAQISDSGNLIFVQAQDNSLGVNSNLNHFFYGDFSPSIETNYEWTPLLFHLFEGERLAVQYITNDSNDFTYFRTNLRAPNFRIVRCRLFHEDPLTRNLWETLVPENRNRLLDWATCVNRIYLMVCYLENSVHALELRKLKDGSLIHKYSLPQGIILDYHGGKLSSFFFFTFTSFLVPHRVHYIRIRKKQPGFCKSLRSGNLKRIENFSNINSQLDKAFDLSGFCVKQQYCRNAHDGTYIPILLIHKKKIKKNGSTPCIVYGQGCFGVQLLSSFSVQKAMFLKKFSGMLAVICVRGGGERGEKWYHEGCGPQKMNTYSDFTSAVEYLIKSGYTSSSKLIAEGELLGGNLVGVCATQRPDLFGATIIHDGLLDMIRFNKFPQSQKWKTEFGDPEGDWFEIIKKHSPVHNVPVDNVVLKNFPAILCTIGRQSALAHPSDSFKFVALLQKIMMKSTNELGSKPFLLRTGSGQASSGAGGEGDMLNELNYKVL